MSAENVKEIVKEKYGNAALRVTSGDGNSCCGQGRSGLDGSCDPITSNLYDAAQEGEVPDTAIKASLGCGKSLPDSGRWLYEWKKVVGGKIPYSIGMNNNSLADACFVGICYANKLIRSTNHFRDLPLPNRQKLVEVAS